MQKLFVADDNFPRVIERSRAKGHKRLVIHEGIEPPNPVRVHTDGTDLIVSPEPENNESKVYTILCKEFGLVGYSKGFRSKISVIFCDEGYMLVTLLDGAIIINMKDQLLMPTAGSGENPKVDPNSIYWVTADSLLEYGKYFDLQGKMMFDFEWCFEVGGENPNGLLTFSLNRVQEEVKDISLGYFAQYVQREEAKQSMKEANKIVQLFNYTETTPYEFDEDDDEDAFADEEEDEEEEDDWD